MRNVFVVILLSLTVTLTASADEDGGGIVFGWEYLHGKEAVYCLEDKTDTVIRNPVEEESERNPAAEERFSFLYIPEDMIITGVEYIYEDKKAVMQRQPATKEPANKDRDSDSEQPVSTTDTKTSYTHYISAAPYVPFSHISSGKNRISAVSEQHNTSKRLHKKRAKRNIIDRSMPESVSAVVCLSSIIHIPSGTAPGRFFEQALVGNGFLSSFGNHSPPSFPQI
jgi:hypothetical protein